MAATPIDQAAGAGSGVVAVSAALRAACGAGAVAGVRAMMVTPFLFSGAIPVSVLTAPGVFWTTIALVRI